MTSLTSALRIATSGMQASQASLSTVSHNIVNANTAGYSRQVIQTGQVSYDGQASGVAVSTIQRQTDNFLTVRALQQQADVSYADTNVSYLSSIESILTNANGEGSLNTLMSGFYESVSDLSNDIGNTSLKLNVVQSAGLLATSLNDMNKDLSDLKLQADEAITSELDSVNATLKRIYDLNVQIATQSAGNATANTSDLQDERDRQVATLGETFKLQVTSTENGGVRLSTEDGRRLVDSSGYVQFERTTTLSATGFQGIGYRSVDVNGKLGTLRELDVNSLSSGSIKALADMRDTIIPEQLAQLDELTSTVVAQVNKITNTGSSVPAASTLRSGNTGALASGTADMLATWPNLAGDTFNISVVTTSGSPVATTAGDSTATPVVVATPITIPSPPATYSLQDLANDINSNAQLGGLVTASVVNNAAGQPILQISATNSSQRVIMGNANGEVLETLGMNKLFVGSTSADIAVRSDIAADPGLLPVGTMRTTDGGLSTLSNDIALQLSQLADTDLSFSAAGGMTALNVTGSEYISSMLSSLAVTIQDAESRQSFATTLYDQIAAEQSGVSGVNLNEELSLMLVYQQSFQASSRMMSTINNMLEELVQILG